ncbi:hypothetical protein RKLH11_1456 [Rhodobacteraceae bacterium KLH11]|nr:hypothetical protein RKLH11_1456 [Rhodobacteraceae bacterium KLH11]
MIVHRIYVALHVGMNDGTRLQYWGYNRQTVAREQSRPTGRSHLNFQ